MNSSNLINQKLLETIDYILPLKSSQLTFLTQELKLGRETAYRRLRGDVPFSLSEACIISEKLGFTLNAIVKAALKKVDPTFILSPSPPDSTQEYITSLHKTYVEEQKLLQRIAADPTSEIFTAQNIIPQGALLFYKNLSKFRILVWKYQMENGPELCPLSSITIDDPPVDMQQIAEKKELILQENTWIISRNIFRSLIKLIQYFFQLNLITDNELSMLKDELLMLVDDLERRTVQNDDNSGKKIWIYLSNLDFESNYTYISTSKFEQSYVDIYYLNSIVSNDPLICKGHRRWIESFKRFSTLISISANIDRINFFEKQRELVHQL